jgi:crotonobetaine/carnitine-CoA ligase
MGWMRSPSENHIDGCTGKTCDTFLLEAFHDLSCFVPRVARRLPDRPALIWPSGVTTYLELEEQTARLANILEGLGCGIRGTVAALMNNSPEFVVAWLSTLRIGGVFAPFNSNLKGQLLGYQIAHSKPKVLFVDEELVGNLAGAPLGETKVIVNRRDSGLLEYLKEAEADHTPAAVSESDPAVVLYTSGTTGPPKGVVLPHYAFINRVTEVEGIVRLRGDDVLYNSCPLYHTSGQVMTTLPALLNGLPVVQQERFHASTYWSFAASKGATVGFLLNRMVNILLNTGGNHVENHLRVIMCGGVRKNILDAFEGAFGVRLLEGFGMTETCGIALYNTLDDDLPGSVGRPLPSVEARLSGANPVEGELELRPRVPNTMFTGYLGERPMDWDGGQWFATGDVLRVDGSGHYYYVDRKKDLIRTRGENVSPTYVERAVEEFPGVLECAAVGVQGELGDEEILVAIKAEHQISPQELLNHLKGRLPRYMVPRYLMFLEEIPKTPTQKIKRDAIKALGVGGAVDLSKLGATN